jgi:hypothetical protein
VYREDVVADTNSVDLDELYTCPVSDYLTAQLPL